MKRTAMLIVALWFVLPVPRPAQAKTYYGFTLGVTNAAPPSIRMVREPRMVLVNDAMVYVAEDEGLRLDGDLFRYGQYWFVYANSFWYRARSHRGPYAAIDVKHVPRAIIGVPRGWWKHHPMAVAATGTHGPVVTDVRRPGHRKGEVYGPPWRDDAPRGRNGRHHAR